MVPGGWWGTGGSRSAAARRLERAGHYLQQTFADLKTEWEGGELSVSLLPINSQLGVTLGQALWARPGAGEGTAGNGGVSAVDEAASRLERGELLSRDGERWYSVVTIVTGFTRRPGDVSAAVSREHAVGGGPVSTVTAGSQKVAGGANASMDDDGSSDSDVDPALSSNSGAALMGTLPLTATPGMGRSIKASPLQPGSTGVGVGGGGGGGGASALRRREPQPAMRQRLMPVEASGRVRRNDALISVNGHSLLGRRLDLVVRLLQIAARAPGQAVQLGVRRARPNSARWECSECGAINVREDVPLLAEIRELAEGNVRQMRSPAERLPLTCLCLQCGYPARVRREHGVEVGAPGGVGSGGGGGVGIGLGVTTIEEIEEVDRGEFSVLAATAPPRRKLRWLAQKQRQEEEDRARLAEKGGRREDGGEDDEEEEELEK